MRDGSGSRDAYSLDEGHSSNVCLRVRISAFASLIRVLPPACYSSQRLGLGLAAVGQAPGTPRLRSVAIGPVCFASGWPELYFNGLRRARLALGPASIASGPAGREDRYSPR